MLEPASNFMIVCAILSCFDIVGSLYLHGNCWEGEGRRLLIRVKLNMITFLVPSKKYRPAFHVEHTAVQHLALLD